MLSFFIAETVNQLLCDHSSSTMRMQKLDQRDGSDDSGTVGKFEQNVKIIQWVVVGLFAYQVCLKPYIYTFIR